MRKLRVEFKDIQKEPERYLKIIKRRKAQIIMLRDGKVSGFMGRGDYVPDMPADFNEACEEAIREHGGPVEPGTPCDTSWLD